MKFPNHSFTSCMSKICAVCLAFLGFGCSSSGDEPCMYGTPTGTFRIKGKVRTADGADVAGAKTLAAPAQEKSQNHSITSAITDSEGNYTLSGEYYAPGGIKVVCLPQGGQLVADSLVTDLKYVRDKNDKDSWNIGHAEATVDFTLKKK